MTDKITECRSCKSNALILRLSLGNQYFGGIFKPKGSDIPRGELNLMECMICGLVQLDRTFDPDVLYGETYGYRSGLNAGMARHLRTRAEKLRGMADLHSGSCVVLDIGSSDGTLINEFKPEQGEDQYYTDNGAITAIGFDPQAERFSIHYNSRILRLAQYFSSKSYFGLTVQKAKIITSLAMFYDLNNPVDFAKQVAECLHPEGIWNIEMHYLHSLTFDAICHEHSTYYDVISLNRVLEQAGLKIVELEFNSVNGGSFSAIIRHADHLQPEVVFTDKLFNPEKLEVQTMKCRDSLKKYLVESDDKTVYALGASTKGNVLLQYCEITNQQITAAVDINPDKFGCVTPGTEIPIISEQEARENPPDAYVVLPWHFRAGIIEREQAALKPGQHLDLIFPLPQFEIVSLQGAE